MNKILLTGATGFIGSHVAEKFIAENVRISCMCRRNSNTSFLKNINTEIIIGDINNFETLNGILSKFDFVIHCAGYVKDWGKYNFFYETNVNGLMNLLKACAVNKIKDIIITGTNSVYGEENNLNIKNEESPFNPEYKYFAGKIFPSAMNHYRISKTIGIKQAIDFAKQNDLNLTVIEPVWVFGEREFSSGFFEYLNTVKKGALIMPGSKKNKFHIVYVKTLANAYFSAYQKKLSGINRFLIGYDNAVNMDYMYNLFCKELKVKKPYNAPKFLVYPIAFLLELIYTFFQIKTPPLLTRSRINMFYDNIEYSIVKAKQTLGFKNNCSLEDAIKNTVEWYKNKGFL